VQNASVPSAGDNQFDKQENNSEVDGVGKITLELIKYEEGHHFTCRRMIFVFVNLSLLLINSFIDNNYPGNEGNNLIIRSTVIVAFVICMFLLTYSQVKRVN